MSNAVQTTTSTAGGGSFVSLLTVAFIVLKLTGYITWSWWWVLSPLWISASFALVFVVLGLFFWGLLK